MVSQIARRHDLTPQQVFTWRRQARETRRSRAEPPMFVPALVDVSTPAVPSKPIGKRQRNHRGDSPSASEV